MNTISRIQHAWWCDRCGQHGPWYSPDDRTIQAGFAVHERNCAVPVVATTGDPLPWFCPGCKQHMPARDARGHDGGGVVYSPRPEFGPVVIPEGDKSDA